MPLQPSFVAPDPLLEPLTRAIGALIGVGRRAMRLETHALPQMNRAVGPKLAALLLDAHMPLVSRPTNFSMVWATRSWT